MHDQGKLPNITTHPEGTRADLGEPVEFRVGVEGNGPWIYQWYHNGAPIRAANQASLTIPSVTVHDFGLYHVEVNLDPPEELLSNRTSRTAYLVNEATHPKTKGQLTMELYRDIPGRLLTDLTNSPKYPNQPDAVQIIDAWTLPDSLGDNYGARIRGYVIPPVTGDYVFYLISDDDSELFISTDESPENTQLVGIDRNYAGYLNWSRVRPEGKSRPLPLQAGKRYWIETRFKENTASDYLAVTWQMPGQPPPRNGDPPISGEFLDPPP